MLEVYVNGYLAPICIGVAACVLVAALVYIMSTRGLVARSLLVASEAVSDALRISCGRLQTERAVADARAERVDEAERRLDESIVLAAGLRDAKAAAETRLAVAAAKADRLDELEAKFVGATQLLDEMEERRVAAEVSSAQLLEARRRLEADCVALVDDVRGLKGEISELRAVLDDVRNQKGLQAEELASVRTTLDQERRQFVEKLTLLQSARESMSMEFRSLAEEIMSRHGETFKAQNREQVELLLSPMRDKIVEFHAGMQAARTQTVHDHASLGEQIRSLMEQSGRVSAEAVALTRALKGNVRTQGAWGEMVLESILERSGLCEGEHYVTQATVADEDGRRLRPDVLMRLPGDQSLVVDSKVSLTAFHQYVNGEAEDALPRHLSSVRSHVQGLSERKYADATGSRLGFVVMFVPVEGAFAAALLADPDLVGFALERDVLIATPSTLMALVRTVLMVWRTEQRNRNAEEIAKRAGRLYDKFVGFLEDLRKVGASLETARCSYDAALGKLSSGSGNLVGRVEGLKQLGAKATKSLPEALLASTGGELPGEEMLDS